MTRDKSSDAIQNYQRAIQIDPTFFRAHNNLGEVLTEQGRVDEAIHHLQAAVGIKPDDSISHRNLGQALQQKGLSDQALIHLFQSYYLRKEYLAAAQLCAETFAADPKLADDVQAGHRYRAARAAAAVGSGADNAAVDEPDRAAGASRPAIGYALTSLPGRNGSKARCLPIALTYRRRWPDGKRNPIWPACATRIY